MSSQVIKVGEFVEALLAATGVSDAETWICCLNCRKAWKDFCKQPLNRASVITMALAIQGQVSSWLFATDDPKESMGVESGGHRLLHEMYNLAVAEGVKISLEEVDAPFTPIGYMAQHVSMVLDNSGMRRVEDGEWILERRRDAED